MPSYIAGKGRTRSQRTLEAEEEIPYNIEIRPEINI